MRTLHRPTSPRAAFLVGALAAACTDGGDAGAPPPDATPAGDPVSAPAARPAISATNAFYYYDDVDAAWQFYTRVMGFETVVDYGFARILRVAPASYLTVVDADRGMHDTDEPRTVTLALVTSQVERWFEYLTAQGVPMRASLTVRPGSAHDGFVAVDPEGYLIEVERFNSHAENTDLLPLLDRVEPLVPPDGLATERPRDLGVQATVLWLYYRDLVGAQSFYEEALGLPLVVNQGWARVHPASATGFVGLVDGERGLHQATDEKSVTVSFFVPDVDAWFGHMQGAPGFELRTPEITDESDRVRVFVGYDPEGYFLEWDTFLDVPDNQVLLALLVS